MGNTKFMILIFLILSFFSLEIFAKAKRERKDNYKSKWAALTSVSFPYPYQVGVGKVSRKGDSDLLGFGSLGFKLPSRGRAKNLKGNIAHLEYKHRSIPFKGHPFYYEWGGGVQSFSITGERTVNLSSDDLSYPIDVRADLKIYSVYLNPKLGFTWFHKGGLFTGFSFGYNLPVYSQASFQGTFIEDDYINQAVTDTESYAGLKSDIEFLGTKAGKLGLPYLQLFELGYIF